MQSIGSQDLSMGVPERVAHIYYSHGLFCSSHPIIVLSVAISVILMSCYPLIYLPLPGDAPLQMTTPGDNLSLPDNRTTFLGVPDFYIQQVVLRTGVSPWTPELQLHDAFRSPLHKVFPLLETIRNYQIQNSSVTLEDLCLHVESVKLATRQERKKLLPEYGCLMLSPANFWQQDDQNFQTDTNLLSTVFNHHSYQKGKISLAEILFGMNMKETGLKRYPLRTRARTIQFAVTMVFKKYDQDFITGLRKKLESQYPLHVGTNGDKSNSTKARSWRDAVHIYYPEQMNVYELLPLSLVYCALYVYMYFSLRKIEPVKSKAGMALSACVTIFSCLLMSIGLCFFFGVTVSVSGKEIYPYLVAVVGLENVLVITKSITSTPAHLDVKIRIAQGLSKEGWSITKNLLIQVTILTMGLATFISAVQELCILGLVGLVCDFFLQLFFFTTILSIDIHRTELSVDQKHNLYTGNSAINKSRVPDIRLGATTDPFKIHRSKSHHNLSTHSFLSSGSGPTNVLASAPGPIPTKSKISRRLQLVHIWTRTRFVQRVLMVSLVTWICCILYSTSFLQQLFHIDEIARFHDKLQDQPSMHGSPRSPILESMRDLNTLTAFIRPSPDSSKNGENDLHEEDESTARFKHRDLDPHRRLSVYHWPVMLSLYNMSLTDKYLTVLPSIRLSQAVSPLEAIRMRNPQETLQWSTLAVALDPLDFSAPDGNSKTSSLLDSYDRPFIPRSPMEIALSCILVLVSVLVLAYMTVVLYRCICTRNYAEWRSSWQTNHEEQDNQVVLEAVALSLEGHTHEVECLATDGYQVASSDLSGQIRVWSAYDGEPVCHIDRTAQFERQISDPELNHSDYESGSPPSRGEPEGHSKRLSLPGAPLPQNPSPIWCLDCRQGVIAVGCADGSIEFWTLGKHRTQNVFDDGSRVGVTSLKLVDHKIIAARLNGSLDVMQLESLSYSSTKTDWGFSTTRRTHVRAASAGSALDWHSGEDVEGELRCIRLHSIRAHQQPITVLECENGRVVTGSQDHTLKVLRLEDYSLLYTLHGHCGPITCMFIDRVTPYLSGSGSQDGLLCVWDLLTGACLYSLQAHDGSITALTYSASYVISLGTDEKMCVWERFLGHLLNTIYVTQTFSMSLAMVTHHLLVSGKQGSLVLWDVRTGDPVRVVRLGHNHQAVYVKLLLQVGDSLVCDYGHQLRIVRFPIITDKTD